MDGEEAGFEGDHELCCLPRLRYSDGYLWASVERNWKAG